MAERCGLFMIIARGESILVTGATFSGLPWTPATVAAFIVAFLGSLAMWSPTEPRTTVAVLGGTALYLVGDALFEWAIAGRLPIPPIVGALLLGPLIPVSAAMSSLALMVLATLVIVAVALWEARARRYCPMPRLQERAENGRQQARH